MEKNELIKSFCRIFGIRYIINRSYPWIGKLAKIWGIKNCSHGTNFEDLIDIRLLGGDKGWYIDIGANDPVFGSNTYKLHNLGFKGINIDPNPAMIERFNKFRPNDINLCLGCDNKEGELAYYCFKEDSYNTMQQEVADGRVNDNPHMTYKTTIVPVTTLKKVLEKNLPVGESISLLDLDAEGMECRILEGNDWEKYRPKVISMECFTGYVDDIKTIYHDPAVKYLCKQDYRVVAKVFNAVFFLDNRR